MKKLLIAFLLSLTCACTVAGAVACKDSSSSDSSSSSSSEVNEGPFSVSFVNGEGYTFVPEFEEGTLFERGDVVRFHLDVNVFYTDNAEIYLNDNFIPDLDGDGAYEVTIQEDSTFTAKNVKKDVSSMRGTGSLEDAFVVTRPIDLLYIAERVNAGDPNYVTGSYVLANDIDCGGEELQIIGDLSTENSYFAGCFATTTNSETGEFEKHTISNFVINSDDTNYVGLFGAVYVDLSVTSSGLFYGIHLDNFTINARLSADAQIDNRSISAGGLIGFGIGANVWLCDATNGKVNVYGDSNYFSYAGGLIGYQQGLYSESMGAAFPSEVVYSVADVDVRILNGMGLCAGGITGYLSSNSPLGAAAYIHNSYATGTVSGALRSGGIAGGLGSYSSISNCYATGNVSARSTKSPNDPLMTDTQFCYSYAGGLVGYAENESIVNDSFATGALSASAINASYAYTGAFIAGGDEAGTATAAASRYVVNNCLKAEELDLADTSFFTNQLGWGKYDWTFKKDSYPTICYDTTATNVTASLTMKYVANGSKVVVSGKEENSLKYFDTSIESLSAYSPLGNYVGGGLSKYMQADNNGYRSYGYFFDAACTQKVPYSYVPQKNVTLYIGFADPAPLLDKTFYLTNGNSSSAFTLSFADNGKVTYSDGRTEQETYYLFDGETLVIEQARLARYYDGEIVVDDTSSFQDPNFDMYRYSYYDFMGSLKDGVLTLYDGTYFTKDAPLTCSTSHTDNPEVLDKFAGSWTKSANVNKVYTFDGKGNWTYTHKAYNRENNGDAVTESIVSQASGTYTLDGESIRFTHDGIEYVATLLNDCLLVECAGKTQRYYAEGSYVGTWNGKDFKLSLEGIGASGFGNAVLTYSDGYVYELIYEMSETDGYVVLYYPHDDYVKDALFGYFHYTLTNNTLTIVIPDELTGAVTQESLFLLDNYNGEWICNAENFLDVEFSFNGNGLYSFLYGHEGMKGSLTLSENGEKYTVEYTLDSILQGKFTYKNVLYTMEYDEDANAIIISTNHEQAELERKDALANIDFVDLNGNHYSFDGRSNLSTNGILTVGDKTYTYLYNDERDGWLVKDDEKEIGSVILSDNCYTLTLNGVEIKLYITNEFMGNWAVGGRFGLLEIGPTDLNDVIQATYLGHQVEITQLDVKLLTFKYREGHMPITYYVYIINDAKLGYDVLVLSQYTSLIGGSYSICTKANELYGSWVSADGFTLRFDGLTNGAYANGTAALSWKNSTNSTPYYYTMSEKGNMLWSQETLGGSYAYYKIELLDMGTADLTADGVFVQRDEEGNPIKALRRTKVDSLYMTEAKDLSDESVVYFFDGEGKLLVDGEVIYTYKIDSFATNDTAYLTLTKDGVEYFAVLDYSKSDNITLKITLEEETPEQEETPTTNE